MLNCKKIILSALISTSLVAISESAKAFDVNAESERFIENKTKIRPVSKITDEILVKGEDNQNDVSDADKIKFTLKTIEVTGNTAMANDKIEAFYADMLGKEVSLADIYKLRDEITKLYRKEGYVLSRAVIPAQRISGGNVKIQIVEGYLNDVIVEGDLSKNDEDLINSYIAKMKQDGPLDSNNLERYLLLLNDVHGLSANGVLRPAASGTGGADFIIVLGNDFYDGIVTIDNSGTRFVGDYIISAQVAANSALGFNERIALRTIQDAAFDELSFGDITYEQVIGDEGTNLRLNFGDSNANPTISANAGGPQIDGETLIFEAELTHPFIRSRRENLTGRAVFAFKNTVTDLGADNIFTDKTRVLEIGGTYDFADSTGAVNLFDLAVHQGFKIFNDSNDGRPTSNVNGEQDFTKITGEVTRQQPLGGRWGLLLQAEGQYSFNPLLVGEEIGFGGDIGRGYDFSEITGDHGLGGSVELQAGFDVDDELIQDTQLYAFYDIAAVWQRNRLVTEQSRETLNSVGIGMRFNFINSFSGFIQLAKPLSRDVTSEGDNGVRPNFGLSYIF